MTKEQFVQQLVIERFKFHLAHLTALLHSQETAGDGTDEASLTLESKLALVRSMNEDLTLLERHMEQAT